QGAERVAAHEREQLRLLEVDDLDRGGRVQLGGAAAGGGQGGQGGEDPLLDRARLGAAAGHLPVHRRAVQPAVVGGQGRVVEVAVVVAQPQLVAHVEQREAVGGEGQGGAGGDRAG